MPNTSLRAIASHIASRVAKTLGVGTAQLDRSQPLKDMGLDSLMAIEVKSQIESDLDIELPIECFTEDMNTNGLADAVCNLMADSLGEMSAAPADTSNWLPLLALIFGTGVIGHSMMNWSLTKVPLWLGSTLTLLIPVVSSIGAWVFLDESLTWVQLAAMAVVIGALATIVMGQRAPQPVRAPQDVTT